MLQRIPLLGGRLLFLLKYSPLNQKFTAARLLSSYNQNLGKSDRPLKPEEPKEKKFICSLCGGNCKCGGAYEHVRKNLTYYASAATLLLAAGLVFKIKKRKVGSLDQSTSKDAKVVAEVSESGYFDHCVVPEEIPYLLIGAGTASYYAALTIRARDENAKILIIGDERHLPYNRPNLTKDLWWYGNDDVGSTFEYKSLTGRTKGVFYETKGFYVSPEEIASTEHGGVSLLTNHRIVKLDIPAHIAYLDDGRKIKYQKCLIATGLSANKLPIFENACPEIKAKTSSFRTLDDFKKLYNVAEGCKSVTIVGSGILASELAYSLVKRFGEKGLVVNQVFSEKGIVAEILPEYLSQMSTEELRKVGVNIFTENSPANLALSESGQVKLTLTSGGELVTDHIVVVAGGTPNTELAAASGLEVDQVNGGFLIDAELRARTDVWIAGAACSYYDVNLGRRRAELWDDAQVTGRLAGENMTGGQKPYWHQAAFYSAVAPGVYFQGVGKTDPSLRTVSVFASEDEKLLPSRGVIFYLDGKFIVGVVLYNVFGYGVDVARRLIADGKEHEEEDLREIAKLFELHKSEEIDDEAATETEKETVPNGNKENLNEAVMDNPSGLANSNVNQSNAGTEIKKIVNSSTETSKQPDFSEKDLKTYQEDTPSPSEQGSEST